MYSEWVLVGLLIVVCVWLGFITYQVFATKRLLGDFLPKSGERDVKAKFEEVIKLVKGYELDLEKFRDRLENLDKDQQLCIQRVSILRYNPYNDTGGDQSFSMALLDKNLTGFVVTSMHSRFGTRVFAKPVILGKAGSHSFSKEEEESIKKAKDQQV
jgi:hypothetical protein